MKHGSRLGFVGAAGLAVFCAHSLCADESARPRLKGGFGAATPREVTTVENVVVIPAPPAVSAPTLVAAASAAPAAPAVTTLNIGCAVRDPEDGSCYSSADAADQAWLARGTISPATPAIQSDDVEEDPDEEGDDSEDGGTMAPVDAPRIDTVAAPSKGSFWRDLGRRLTRLVVRKADSRPASIPEEELAALFTADFPLPIRQFPDEKLRDSFDAPRGSHRRHHAIDLPAPQGTPVIAVVNGVVERIGRDHRGGKVCYLRDLSGRFTFYYAHLSQHEKGLRPGDRVKKGQRLGYVGSTGHSSGPHLHFAIFRQDGAPALQRGLVLNPYLIFTSIIGK